MIVVCAVEEPLVAAGTTDPVIGRAFGNGQRDGSGGVREIVVDAIEPAPTGTYLQVWLINPDATRLYSLGGDRTEHGRRRPD